MDYTGIIYLAVVGAIYAFFWRRSPAKAGKSIASGLRSFKGILPTLLAVFGLVGLFDVFIPPSLIQRLMGSSGGITSLLVGTGLGSIATGPPADGFPIAATLLKAGAWPASVAAFIVSWILVGFVSLPMESEIFGWRFAVLRNGLSIVVAMAIGLIMGVFIR